MRVTLDDDGRIALPAALRERLGLAAGASLEVTVEAAEGRPRITLRPDAPPAGEPPPAAPAPALKRRGRVLVHTGRLAEADYDVVAHLRRARR
jgi:AbrB family looped-hinge helix DNA binding protein